MSARAVESVSKTGATAMKVVGSGNRLAQYQDWSVYSYNSDKKRVCYIGSFPINDAGVVNSYTSYVLVTEFIKGSAEFSTSIPNKSLRTIEVNIDNGKRIPLYTEGSMGWAMNSKDDSMLTSVMRRGRFMYVTVPLSSKTTSATAKPGATSAKQQDVQRRIDRYSLIGFSAAYKHMQESCK